MKIKPVAELAFVELVSQPILPITRTAIQLRQQMCQPMSLPQPA
jgi:hypothetical protein